MDQVMQHVGVTRSGKAVQVPIFREVPQFELPAECALYSSSDHFDAYAVFEYLVSRELSRRPQDRHALKLYLDMSFGHRGRLGAYQHQAERLNLGLATIFDVLDHGKSLADRIFKD